MKSEEELKNLIKKLKNLAERGVGGEKVTAQEKLDKLLAANNLTEDDLEKEEVNYYLFSYQYPYLRPLLGQLIYKTIGQDYKLYHSKGTRNKLGTYCTPAQKIEIELDFEFYSAIFNEELKAMTSGFIQKQELFPEDSPVNNVDLTELSDSKLAELQKIMAYSNNMDKRIRPTAYLEDKENADE